MPKSKTNRATAKRFKMKKSGKVRFKKAQSRHLLTLKGTKRKRQKGRAAYVATSDVGKFRRLLPHG